MAILGMFGLIFEYYGPTFLAAKSSSILTHGYYLGKGRAISHDTVIFQDRTSKFCMVVHIGLPQKVIIKFQKGVTPRDMALVRNSVFFQAGNSKFCMVVHIDPPEK